MSKPQQETDEGEEEEEEDKQTAKIAIDNRSTFGAAIISRVRQCPLRQCKKNNVKVDRDNWIICSGCMKQFCFVCGRIIFGTRHFGKKCQRYTSF